MPQPSKEQFDAAARKVMQTAPAGLTREQFFDLIDKELSGGWTPEGPTAAEMIGRTGRMAPPQDEHEPDTFTGGFIRGLKKEFVDPLVNSGTAWSASHPGITQAGKQKSRLGTLQDMASLTLPSSVGFAGFPVGEAAERYWQATKAAGKETKSFKDALTLPVRSFNKMRDALPTKNEAAVAEFLGPRAARTGYKPDAPVINNAPDLVDKYMPKVAKTPPTPAEMGVETAQETLTRKGPVTTPDTGVPQGEMPQSTASMVEPYKPNVGSTPDAGVAQDEALLEALRGPAPVEVDRYHPNTSGTPDRGVPQGEMPTATPPVEVETPQDLLKRLTEEPSGKPVQTDRVPYNTPDAPVPPDATQPSLEDVLNSTLQDIIAEKPAPVSGVELPPDVKVGGTRRPKLGKRPGGYITDNPPKPAYEAPTPATPPVEPPPSVPTEPPPVTEPPTGGGGATGGGDVTVTPEPNSGPGGGDLESFLTEEEALSIRRHWGSRDGGAIVNPENPAEGTALLEKLAPGPSRTPIVAEGRMNHEPRDLDIESMLRQIITEGLYNKPPQ